MSYEFGHTLLVINPVAQSGAADAMGTQAEALLAPLATQLTAVRTTGTEHAIQLGREAAGYDTVIVLGGDGVIHHVAQGLLSIPKAERPVLGIVPVGSGNDYARTLGVPVGAEAAVAALAAGHVAELDVARANDEFFLETLSFGLDAAIAVETMERRKRTGESGMKLYLKSAIDQVLHHLDAFDYRMVLDGERVLEGTMKLLAIQNGVTYGGGFMITPEADAADGLLDICIADASISTPTTLVTLVKAMNGKHTKSPYLTFARASKVEISVTPNTADYPKCQVDGEGIDVRTAVVEVLPREIRVLRP